VLEVSLNEIENLALKSARGSGFDWGLAEEAARAARWLAARNLSWSGSLAAILEANAAGRLGGFAWTGTDVVSSVDDLDSCPIRGGACLSDFAPVLARLFLPRTLHPLWLLPFADTASNLIGVPIHLRWSEHRMVVGPNGTFGFVALSLQRLSMVSRADLAMEIGIVETTDLPLEKWARRAASHVVPESDWRRLQHFEHFTYVPASETSRLSGAGAGIKDND